MQYKSGVGQLSEGRAYIEGGRQYQQRKDSYDDLIDELLFDEQPEQPPELREKKTQIASELREAQDAFYKGTRDTIASSATGQNEIPHYADYIYSGSEGNSADERSASSPPKISQPVELPSRLAFFEKIDFKAEKSLDQEHTVHAAKPKKQKKKRKTRVVLPDDEPIKQIEIIRALPEEKVKPEKFTGKP